ncbi:MAG: hypothetical protein Q8N01_05140 [Sulfuricurvum sp.]|nr:hypothetical protein [Sulfuricurvum sp.]
MANLLIGNGINLLNDESKNWEKLLQQVSIQFDKNLNMEGKSNLHVYEELYTKALHSGKDEDTLRIKIVEQLSDTRQNFYHKKILNLPFSNIFTTNYDYGFTPNQQQKNGEIGYSLRRFQYANNKKVWHIHGELNAPNSIMLGYDHYMRSIGKMQGYLKIKKTSLKAPNEFWVDKFLEDDLYILGLGLDFNEIDLWWLLAYRNRKILEGKIKRTSFVYIDIIDIDKLDEKARDSINTPYNPKKSMLDAYKVEVNPFYIGHSHQYKNYSEAYDAIIEYLASKIG